MSNTTRPALEERSQDAQATFSVKKITVMAVFIALSAVGALIKIPSPLGTIAFDSAPGFFVALGFTGWMGAIVAAIGHLLTAGFAGFPQTIPVHLFIAAGMAVCAWILGSLKKYGTPGMVGGLVLAALLNSFGIGLVLIPIAGMPAYLAATPFLLAGAVANLAVSVIAWLVLRKTSLLD